MIPEREREALMRLTMCARIECDICIYKGDSIEKCDERITKNMNILADALRADRKTEPSGYNLKPVEDEPQTERYCTNCKHNGVIADYECRECNGMDKHEFIEPQTDVYEYNNGEWVKPDCPWE